MTTAEAIEALKDAGEFEILALRVLRLVDDDCKFLIHQGVNEKGKTIKNPLDGFCLVPGSNPLRYVMAAFATNEVTSLEKKWIFDHTLAPRSRKAKSSDDGDLIKASIQAEKIRKDFPNAKFVLHLCTNRVPDSKWLPNVYKKAAEFGIEINILEQSRLRDCLDTMPEGQWLRKQHLGIEADLLSLSLLKHLAELNQERYSQEFFITPTSNFIDTENKRRIYTCLEDMPEKTIHVLLGKSGCGKSVISFQTINELLKRNALAIRIPGEVASRSISLEEAIDSTLRLILPIIQEDSGKVALSYSSIENPLTIVIDDINRTSNPSEIIRKILTWANPAREQQNNKSWIRKWTIILPTWDIHWEVHEETFKSASWINPVLVQKMVKNEATFFLKNSLHITTQINEFDLNKIVDELDYDPILLAMFSEFMNGNPSENPFASVNRVISKYVNNLLKDIATHNKYLLQEYENVLCETARYMLINRNLYPSWNIVSEWLTTNDIEILRELVKDKKLCEIRNNLSETQFSFRHDRILEYYLTKVLNDLLLDYTSNDDILSDPFYYHFISRALTLNEYPLQLIDWLKNNNMLSLVSSIRYLESPCLSDYDKKIVQNTIEVVSKIMQSHSHESYINKVIHLLESINSPLVLEITNSFKTNIAVSLARLLNGDLYAGIIYFLSRNSFFPNTNFPYLVNLIDQAKKNHFTQLVNSCNDLLECDSSDITIKIASLTIAGYLGSSELENSIIKCWVNTEKKKDILIAALWAAFRCGENILDELLSPMLYEWSLLSDKNDNGVYSERVEIAEELRFAMPQGISEKVLTYLTDTAYKSESLRFVVAYLLEHVYQPIAVGYVVKVASELNDKAKKAGAINPWASMLYHNHGNHFDNILLSAESLSAIKQIWENSSNPDWLGSESFHIWTKVCTNMDELKMIQPDHPQFESVVWRRAQLGDLTTIPFIKTYLQKKSSFYYLIPYIWCKDSFELIDSALYDLKKIIPQEYSKSTTNEEYLLADALRKIPIEDSDLLLYKHFNHLKYSSRFILASLYVGTNRIIELAKHAISEYSETINPLEHIGNYFGFMTTNLKDKLSLKHLNSISTYLQYMSSIDLMEIMEYCIQHNLYTWSKMNLFPEVQRRVELNKVDNTLQRIKTEYFSSDDEQIDVLNRIEREKHSDYHIYNWCESFYKRNEKSSRWKNIIENWLEKAPSISRLKILGAAISQFGDRSDLQLLTKYKIEGDTHEIDDVIDNIKFSVMIRTLQ